jgi:hypothetical protein
VSTHQLLALGILAVGIIAAAALTLAILLMRQNGNTTADLRRHRLSHERAEGYPDPVPWQDPPQPPRGADRYHPPTDATRAVHVPRGADGQLDLNHPAERHEDKHLYDPHATVERPAQRPRPREDTPR